MLIEAAAKTAQDGVPIGDIATWAGVVVAVVFSIIAVIQVRGANTHASQGNTIAKEANTIAHRADERSERSEQRQTERNDVVWKSGWVEPRIWGVTNLGQDTACGATLMLRVNGESYVVDLENVGRGESIRVDLGQQCDAEAKRARDAIRSASQAGVAYFPSTSLKIGHRLTWQTSLGTWHLDVAEVRSTGLGKS